jgi:hypothetical protein
MSDATPHPDTTDPAPAEPAPAAAATGPVAAPATDRWWNRRLPLVLTAAALVLGCFLGACAIGVGAIVIGYGDRGDNRGYGNRDGYGGGRGRQDAGRPGRGDHRDQPAPATPTPGASAPSTGASTLPPSPAAS